MNIDTKLPKIYGSSQFTKQDSVIIASKQYHNSYIFKNGMARFCFLDSFDTFINKYILEPVGSKSFYELIPFSGKLPLYLDIEYSNDTETKKPLLSFIELFKLFMDDKFPNKNDQAYPDWKISMATRKKVFEEKLYWYHSFHLVLHDPNYYFGDMNDMRCLLKTLEYWAQTHDSDEILNLYQNTMVENIKTKKKGIIDYSVYNRNHDTRHAFRMPFSQKNEGADILMPMVKNLCPSKLKEYFVTWDKRYSENATEICIPDSWRTSSTKIKKPPLFTTPTPSCEIPDIVVKKIVKLFKNYHPNAKFIKSEIDFGTGDYIIKFLDLVGNCLKHKRNHTDTLNNNYYIIYRPNSNKYLYCCRSPDTVGIDLHCTQYFLEPKNDINNLLNWNYEYEDKESPNCVDLVPTQFLQEYGTHLHQAPKGTGKTISMCNFIRSELKANPKVKILNITYRMSLASKYEQELDEFGFHYYKNPVKEQSDLNKMVILIDSLHKLVNQAKDGIVEMQYDIIIIDEIYSVLEGWSSSLMGTRKRWLMSIFEQLVKNCKYLYLLDAHLNNKLVINTISKLRDPVKFVSYRNPRCFPYGEYVLNWYEPKKRKGVKMSEMIDKNKFLKKMFDSMLEGKKIGFISSTKTMTEEIGGYIEELRNEGKLPLNFTFKIYNGDTSTKQKKDELSVVEDIWKDINFVAYSPTISAGTSYNLIGSDQFDELYVYYICPNNNTASFNTLNQMLFRIRQLNLKTINLFFDTDRSNPYKFDDKDLEKDLLSKSESIFEALGSRPTQCNNILDKYYQPVFDTDHWSYSLWVETARNKIKYSKDENFKKGLIQELTNSPQDPLYAGRGMKLIDHSLKIEKLKINPPFFVDLDKLKQDIEDSKDKMAEKKYNTYMDVHDGTLVDQYCGPFNPTECYNLLKAGQNISEISTIKLDLWRLSNNSVLQINFDKIRDHEDNIEIFTKIMDFKDVVKLDRRKIWLSNIDLNNTTKWTISKSYNNESFNPNNKIKYVQILEEQFNRGIVQMQNLKEIFELLDLDYFRKDLNGLVIDRKIILEFKNDNIKLFKFYNLLIKLYKDIIPDISGDVQKYQKVRNALRSWYQNNPGKHIYDKPVTRLKLIKDFNLVGIGKISDLKSCKWVPRVGKAKIDFDNKCLAGLWTCSDWQKLQPQTWSCTIIKNILEKILHHLLGYKFEKNDPTSQIETYILIDDYEWLKEFSNDELLFKA